MRIITSLLVVLCFLYGPRVFGDEVFLIQVSTPTPSAPVSPYLHLGTWGTQLILYNRGDSPAEVRLLGISNGPLSGGPASLFLEPRKATSLITRHMGWYPRAPQEWAGLWVLRLDIPPEVLLENSMLSELAFSGGGAPPWFFPLGRISLPVFRSLTPPDAPQVHLGADLGFAALPSRINVGIYNASPDLAATAHIEIRSICDDSILQSRIVSIPPNTIHQFGGFGARAVCGIRAGSSLYVVVTVDQPSLSYVAALRNDDEPAIGTVILP